MSEQPKKKMGGLIKILIAVAVIGAVFAIAHFTGLTGMINLEGAQELQQWFIDLGWLGWLVFIGIYILVAVFMLPAFIFTVVAGLAFGPIIGALLALVGATIGATVAFIIARYVARDAIVGRFKDNRIFAKIEDGFEKNGVSFLILTRLVPAFPYNIQNYIYGLTSIKLPTFVLVTFITMAPGAFIYAFIAGQIIEQGGVTWQLMVMFAAAGVILFLVSLIPKAIAKRKGIKLEDDKTEENN
ncbi:MAG: TVP38/TMEM64 family protein [Defluviitaleaceae bacterium]|nr:TVP38/TMEM64 family protein [Defluviitaleaceae bacterium]